MAVIAEDRFDKLVDLVYDAGVDGRNWPRFLDALATAFDGKGLLYVYDTVAKSTPMALPMGFGQPIIDTYLEENGGTIPYASAAIRCPVDTTIYAHDVVAPELVSRTPFYADFMRPLGISLSHLAIKPVHNRNRMVMLGLSPNSKVFERAPDESYRCLDRLRPHITRAIEISRYTADATQVPFGVDAMLRSFAAAALLLDREARPLHMNAVALELMRNERLLGLDASGALIAARSRDSGRLAAMIAGARRQGSQRLRLVSPTSGKAFLAWTVPVARRDDADEPSPLLGEALAPCAAALLLIVPIEAKISVSPELVQEALAITAAEACLVAALVAGETVSEFAERKRLSPKTVRNQLAAVFGKTVTTRQSELVALVIKTLGPLSALGV